LLNTFQQVSLSTQLEDTKRLADEESREKATLLGKFRNVEHDLDVLREQLEEISESKSEVQKGISKSNAEAQFYRAKYESEGLARIEELEGAKYVIFLIKRFLISILTDKNFWPVSPKRKKQLNL
jgi:predicted nuclease with TOPRIM domain